MIKIAAHHDGWHRTHDTDYIINHYDGYVCIVKTIEQTKKQGGDD